MHVLPPTTKMSPHSINIKKNNNESLKFIMCRNLHGFKLDKDLAFLLIVSFVSSLWCLLYIDLWLYTLYTCFSLSQNLFFHVQIPCVAPIHVTYVLYKKLILVYNIKYKFWIRNIRIFCRGHLHSRIVQKNEGRSKAARPRDIFPRFHPFVHKVYRYMQILLVSKMPLPQ